MTMFFAAKLSAKQVCILSWWCAQAGAVGFVTKLKHNPRAARNGHFQRHLDTVLKTDPAKKGRYRVDVPAYRKWDLTRTAHPLIVTPPHEAIATEIAEDPPQLDDLQASREKREWPKAGKRFYF